MKYFYFSNIFFINNIEASPFNVFKNNLDENNG